MNWFAQTGRTITRWLRLRPLAPEEVFTPGSAAKLTYVRRKATEKKVRAAVFCRSRIPVILHAMPRAGVTTIATRLFAWWRQKPLVVQSSEELTLRKLVKLLASERGLSWLLMDGKIDKERMGVVIWMARCMGKIIIIENIELLNQKTREQVLSDLAPVVAAAGVKLVLTASVEQLAALGCDHIIDKASFTCVSIRPLSKNQLKQIISKGEAARGKKFNVADKRSIIGYQHTAEGYQRCCLKLWQQENGVVPAKKKNTAPKPVQTITHKKKRVKPGTVRKRKLAQRSGY